MFLIFRRMVDIVYHGISIYIYIYIREKMG